MTRKYNTMHSRDNNLDKLQEQYTNAAKKAAGMSYGQYVAWQYREGARW